jgi:hypothetical protein
VELFFKWIKQHLRIKRFYGTSENAVKTQIWIAVSVYVLVAIVRKRLGLQASLYTFAAGPFGRNIRKSPDAVCILGGSQPDDLAAAIVRGAKVRALPYFSLAPIRSGGLSASCAAAAHLFRAKPSSA